MKKTHQIISIPIGTKYFFTRSEEELDALLDHDIRNGTTLDSSGEPKIYSKIISQITKEETIGTVIRTKGVAWEGTWYSKPKHLIDVLATIDGIPRIVKIQDPREI